MILFLLSFFTFTYIYFGLFVFIQIFIWTIIFFLSNFLHGINPLSKEFIIIRIMSILVIIFILYYNSGNLTVAATTILPLSISKITYVDEINQSIYIGNGPRFEVFESFEIEETKDFLTRLEDDANYLINMEFIPDVTNHDEDAPQLILSKPFLINTNSSPTTITKFINERLNFRVDYFYLDDSIIQNTGTTPIVKFTFVKVTLF